MTIVRAPRPSRIIRRALAALAVLATIAASFTLLPTDVADASSVSDSTASIVRTAPDLAKLCARLKITVAKTTLCSHGPDPVAAFGGAAKLKQTSALEEQRVAAAPASELTALCSAGGVSGKRIEVIYGVPQDRTNRFAEMLAPLRDIMRQVNNNLEAVDAATSQSYRFLCTNGADVTVRNVTLAQVGTDGTYTFDDYVVSMQNQVERGLGPVNYIVNDRLYITYIDQIQDVYPYGGQGELTGDDQPSAAANANNDSRPRYSMSAYLDMSVIAHEIGHNIGAVQDSAPHSTKGGHCYDENDLMCYDDGGPYFALGGRLTFTCVGLASAVDCHSEDYYYPGTPPASNYLATHWNTANSGFLSPIVSVVKPSPPTAVTAIAGDARVFVGWAGPAAGAPVVDLYNVVVIAPSGDQWLWAGDGSERTATINGLTNGTPYTVSVSAENSSGSSARVSAPTTVIPKVAAIRETFTSSAANFTEIRGGTWAVASGRYSLTAPSTAAVPNANLALQKTVMAGDFSVMATGMTVASTSPWNDFSIVFDYRDALNYYFANFSEGQDAASNGLFRVSRGVAAQIADFAPTITANTFYSIRIERQGAAIRVFRGTTLLAAAADATFSSGRVGFGSKNDAAKFDDLIVTGTIGGTDTTAPTVAAKSPVSLATRVAQTANTSATFSEAVQGVSPTTMRLKNAAGSTVSAAVSYDAATRIATLNPSASLAPDAKYAVSLIGGATAIRDGAGNPLVSTGWSFTTGPAPTITVRTPSSGATGVSRIASISATFSEGMAGVAASTFTLKNTVTGARIAGVVSRSGTTNKWILNPGSTLAARTSFTVTVTGGTTMVRDLAGNPVSTSTWKFTTGS
ncbi:Ig-like domain-containing protein [Cryobacterium sp. Hb1]|uniref:Ig-like domain-containing protein n=1 Tax=Cryobacterium sp. Hb1 TaxID=1259147 RepID=UPI00106CD89E|nr:Ig-like domain-containing protein [Cryobacterium sp. Hb1]TFD70600.1 hypothetical protein E3T38_05025 [Cryobacterium sp. Hb1]